MVVPDLGRPPRRAAAGRPRPRRTRGIVATSARRWRSAATLEAMADQLTGAPPRRRGTHRRASSSWCFPGLEDERRLRPGPASTRSTATGPDRATRSSAPPSPTSASAATFTERWDDVFDVPRRRARRGGSSPSTRRCDRQPLVGQRRAGLQRLLRARSRRLRAGVAPVVAGRRRRRAPMAPGRRAAPTVPAAMAPAADPDGGIRRPRHAGTPPVTPPRPSRHTADRAGAAAGCWRPSSIR